MSIEVNVPMLPESVADATVLNWHKQAGDAVTRDETIVELETDKVILEVPAPNDGVLTDIKHPEGSTVLSNEILAIIKAGAQAAPKPAETPETPAVATPAAPSTEADLSPAVRRLVSEHGLDASAITGTGKQGRITKDDVQKVINQAAAPANAGPTASSAPASHTMPLGPREEKRVPMSRLRKVVAGRLLSAQHNSAMLTTFNEVNLQAVMDIRAKYKDTFMKQHDTKLGFMSFFTKASVEALKRFPSVNASIDGDDIVYHGYFDVGIAVSTERGLVVPVLRDVDTMSMADIEKSITDYAVRARGNKLGLDDLQGGTFTITNGGTFGSLLSTPIINPPQVGILGMHKIEQRAVVENGEIVARPMMYIALSYDHRLIDGRESVQFLATIKELLEDPARLLLNI